VSNKKERNKRLKKINDFSKRVRGIQREEHFKNGGTLEEWRGKHSVEVDKKKEDSKRKCRKNSE
jgi:hypothetical protein